MHAVVIDQGNLRLEERPDPVIGSTEVLLDVAAAGINAADLLQRRGAYPAPPGSPADIPGLEVAGRIVARGSQVTTWSLGDRVMAVVGGGGQATRCVVDESHLLAIPETLSDEAAGGFPEAYSTAYDALVTQGRLTAGSRLLVTGAAGGVGSAAVQLGRAMGARVVASVRDPARREQIVALGADEAIDPAEMSSRGPYDVVLELVGAPSLESVIGALAPLARIVVIGVGAGASLSLNLLVLMGSRASISASMLRARNRVDKALVAKQVSDHVLPLVARGDLTVSVLDTFAFSRATEAYERFASGAKLGKIVLVPDA